MVGGEGGPVAQIFRCDLCESLAGKPGLQVRVGLGSLPFEFSQQSAHDPSEPFPMAIYNDLCLACAQRIVNFLDDRASGKRGG